VRFHFFHHSGPVDFNGLFGDAQFTRQRLVKAAFEEQAQHLALARCEARKTILNRTDSIRLASACEEFRNAVSTQEIGFFDRFRQETCRTAFIARTVIAMSP
jgi:hypothetical protein